MRQVGTADDHDCAVQCECKYVLRQQAASSQQGASAAANWHSAIAKCTARSTSSAVKEKCPLSASPGSWIAAVLGRCDAAHHEHNRRRYPADGLPCIALAVRILDRNSSTLSGMSKGILLRRRMSLLDLRFRGFAEALYVLLQFVDLFTTACSISLWSVIAAMRCSMTFNLSSCPRGATP